MPPWAIILINAVGAILDHLFTNHSSPCQQQNLQPHIDAVNQVKSEASVPPSENE